MAKIWNIWYCKAKYSFTFTRVNKSYKKRCKKCSSHCIKRDGFMRWKQRYKCKNCWYVFQNKTRAVSHSSDEVLWKDYSVGKQTYAELSTKHGISKRTVQKKLDDYVLPKKILIPRPIILLVDTTYFWNIGVMAFKDAIGKNVIHCRLVVNESASDYKLWVKELQDEWWTIEGIVCDGKRWLLWGFGDIPTQMCQFHQVAIIRRYVTKKPKIQANKDLKALGELLTRTDKETFEYALNLYGETYKDFLREKSIWPDGKSRYTHKKTRSAYFSLRRNLQYLFVWYNRQWKLAIPNTTNWLEWYFSHLKSKVRIHRWLKKERKIKLILSLLLG